MPTTLPGFKIWENTIPLLTANSPLVTGWYDTTGYTSLLLTYVFTTGTTTMTVEGSFDGATLDSTMTYAAVGASPATVVVQHSYVRFRLVQTVGNATVTTVFAQARA